jgi:hypothetical protein
MSYQNKTQLEEIYNGINRKGIILLNINTNKLY